MSGNQQVNQILEEFSGWSKPWTYIRETLATRGLSAPESRLVKEIWEEANASVHWVESGFQSGQELVHCALKRKYPWLSDGAIQNLVRGASYMWK